MYQTQDSNMNILNGPEPNSAGLPLFKSKGPTQRKTADNFYKAEVQDPKILQSGQGGMASKTLNNRRPDGGKTLSMLQYNEHRGDNKEPSRDILSGQRQRSDSMYQQNLHNMLGIKSGNH